MPVGSLCRDETYEVTSENECKQEGESLGLQWGAAWNGANDFPACLYADDGRNLVYFNLSPNPTRTLTETKHKQYSAICKTPGKKNHFYSIESVIIFHAKYNATNNNNTSILLFCFSI